MSIPILSTQYDHVNRFINELAPLIINEYMRRYYRGEHRINPSVALAQASCESGYNLNAETLFGIKGEGKELDTSEYINGEYVEIRDSFVAYPSLAEAVQGYYDLLQWDNYADATTPIATSYLEQIDGLTNDNGYPYATSPTYYNTIKDIVESFNLTIFDDYVEKLVDDILVSETESELSSETESELSSETESELSSETESELSSETESETYYERGCIVLVKTDNEGNVYDSDGTLCHCWYDEYVVVDCNDNGVCLSNYDDEIFARIPYSHVTRKE